MKRLFIFLTVTFLCGSTFGQARFKERTENWLKRSAQSSGDASLRSGNEASQGGNRAGDETPEGEVGVGTPVGDAVYWMLLMSSAYACFYLPKQKRKLKIINT